MNEIFGEGNFVAQLVWEKGRKNDAKLFSVGHEYMLVYARSLLELRERKTVWREEKPGARDIWDKYLELRTIHGSNDTAIERDLSGWYASLPKGHPAKKWSRYKRVDTNGPWRDRDISWPGGGGPRYDVIHPKTQQPCVVPEAGWRYTHSTEMQRQIKLGLVEFREDHTKPPFRKAHIRPVAEELEADGDFDDAGENVEDGDEGFASQVRGSYFYKQSQVAVKYLRTLLGPKLFNNPKDHDEIAKLTKYVMGTETSGLILDFFAGSGTTAQAVLELNAQDGGNRKFILVQLPEPTGRKDFPTIADITKERVRRVIKKISAAEAEKQDAAASQLKLGGNAPVRELDLGFKVFKLGSSNFKVWDAATAPKEGAALAEQLKLMAHNVEDGRPDDALLYELVLKSNLPLTSKIITGKIGEQPFYDVADGALVICLARKLTQATLRGLMARKPKGVICLDIAFAGNDQLKANIVLEMKSHGIEFHTA
jgi:adenine-specific DNA-methyltransferase